ncbi:MAG: TonB-dependent receptor [Muribaculaceae bacterium]|nr:TonB-dependent receptor [Muribaculaceae bacterium]
MSTFAVVKKLLFILTIVFSTLPMWATDTEAVADTITLGDVNVTAIKQGADIDLTTASTVLDRREVERNGIVTVRGVSNLVPNFFLPEYGSRMTSTIYVRGLGARIDQPSMGLNIDNVPVMCKENYDFDIADIARVEMLRGPQSTLYGRNTMGGLMNVYTLSPMQWQGTRIIAEMASHMTVKVGASHYARINDKLGIAGGIYYTTTSGQYTNQYNGKKCDWERQGTGRLKLVWQPSSSLMLSNTLSASISRQGGYPYEWVETGQIAYDDTCFYRRTSIMDGLTITKHFDHWSLSSITSYQYLDDNMTLDNDFTPLPYFTLTQARREHAVTQDVVARGDDSRAYKWLVGAFGFYRRYKMDAPVTFKDTGIARLIEDHINGVNPYYPVVWNERSFVLGSRFTNPTWGVALYHQSSYDWKRFTFTAGLRLDYEHTSLNHHSKTHTGYRVIDAATGEIFHSNNIDIDDGGSLSKHFTELLPKFSITYHLPTAGESSIYASVSKGYKAGGFNTQMFSDVLQQRLMGIMGIGAAYDINDIVGYKPEKAWNYEIGGHFESANRRVRGDLALFYINCSDRQMTIFPDGTTTGRIMTNAGKTRSVGAEASLGVNFTDNLGMNLSYGYCDARFVRYNDGKADYKDKHVPYCPQHTLFAQAFYTYNFKGGSDWAQSITLDASLKGTGEIYWNEANTQRQPFYALLGSSITLAGKHYSLQLWGQNLTGTCYNTFYFVSISHEFLQRGRSRMLGATLRINI